MTPNATATAQTQRRSIISLKSVTVAFGGLLALKDVDLEVTSGERLAVLGPNGAGKTTLFNAIAGDTPPTKGEITIRGVDCTNLAPRFRPRLGVARTYQSTRLFDGLTVEDNLYLAQLGDTHRRFLPWKRRRDAMLRDAAHTAAGQVWLSSQIDMLAGDLAHGQRRQLEIGMAIVNDPRIMMLDEPASGLSRGEREKLLSLINSMASTTTLLLIEHDMDVALNAADRVIVMSDGEIMASGTPSEIRSDPHVRSIYLGSEETT
jgi:branched-chain amino acid transport system ATP-binding protein